MWKNGIDETWHHSQISDKQWKWISYMWKLLSYYLLLYLNHNFPLSLFLSLLLNIISQIKQCLLFVIITLSNGLLTMSTYEKFLSINIKISSYRMCVFVCVFMKMEMRICDFSGWCGDRRMRLVISYIVWVTITFFGAKLSEAVCSGENHQTACK